MDRNRRFRSSEKENYALNGMQLPVANSDISSGLPQSVVPAFSLIDDRLGQVKKLLDEQLAGSSEPISRLLGYVNTHGGKMLRPGLVLLAGSCCGKITDEHIRVAAIVEMIHSATLLHDDVIDEGQKRRGLPTINSLWGNESAVLLGDFLLSKVFKMCADLKPQVARIIAATTVRVCEGELRQIVQRRNWQLSESEYIDIITEKSASFFSSCCSLGALLAQASPVRNSTRGEYDEKRKISNGASETQVRSLARFGRDVGIAFQITDDLLDIIGNESKTGKTLGCDVNKNKLTLAVIHLLRAVDEKGKDAVKSKLNTAGEGKEALVEMLRSYGSLEYAHSRAQEFITKALQALTGLKEDDAKDALIETARFVGRRAI